MLLKVEIASDTFLNTRGICLTCFRNGDIEEKAFHKQKEMITEQIEHIQERLDYWKEELSNFNESKRI